MTAAAPLPEWVATAAIVVLAVLLVPAFLRHLAADRRERGQR